MKNVENLKAGESCIISEYGGITCTAERSTDGKRIRFVRTYANGSFEVFHTSYI